MATTQPRPRAASVAPIEPATVPALPEGERRRLPRTSTGAVAHGPGLLSINHGSTFMVAGPDASMDAAAGTALGLFADDTRFLCTHQVRVNGHPLRLVSSSKLSFRQARWTLMAPELSTEARTLSGVRVSVTVDRRISDRRMHEDLTVAVYGREAVSLLLEVELGSDFADIFEVRTARWQRRSDVSTTWTGHRLETGYRRDDFVRRCVVQPGAGAPAEYANGALRFPIDARPGEPVRICLQFDLLTSPRSRPPLAPCPSQTRVADRAERMRRRWMRTVARVLPADIRVLRAYEQSVEDFAALRLYDHDFSQDVWLPAAGIPWFVAVFGRDSILASLQALPVHPLFAIGTLQKLAAWQADSDDPVRDAEPGKICHEMRVGEWAQFQTVPHSPYYGTADATPLYLMLLAETHRWMGDAVPLRRFRDTALRCLDWIDVYGDRDGDGFQEYAPRSPSGYRNQCWRDAEDGVLDEDGNFPPHPIGTCEMQAYVHDAKLGMADLLDAWGDADRAAQLRDQAVELRRRFVDAYWVEADGTLAFALDGAKRKVRTATANSGQCLWLGMLDQDRGRRAAARLMQGDLHSGWGLRTLGTGHPAYDPHSYQRGSVWPHDTMLAAAGMRRYGCTEWFWQLLDGLFAAVNAFEPPQMPELFCGLQRGQRDVPVPYEQANVPQAWAAGAVFQAVRLMLGLEADVPNGRIYVDPLLPPWCPELTLDNVRVGRERITVHARRRSDGRSQARVESHGRGLQVVHGRAPWLAVPPRT